jgi:hypothetical protein
VSEDREKLLEEALLEYVELYGLTSKTRELFREENPTELDRTHRQHCFTQDPA